jgi:putative spermidine/putrescine transport system ATP-binding protein
MGSRLDIVGLRKSFAGIPVLSDMSLSLIDGEFVSLLGPSGCGKTTTLNLVAGFFEPDAGSVMLDARDITQTPTHQRGVSMVFQNYALFPHMTIAQNIGFALKMRGTSREAIAKRVQEMLSLVQLPGVGERYPRQLSGGQQQRIGLARALAMQPGLMVLDEPMSNLDAKLRRQMQLELRAILKSVGTTTLYVTHDQEEALAMSDRVVVMHEGRIQQIGTPTEVYHAPSNRFVASFVGDSNFIDGVVSSADGETAKIALTPELSIDTANAHGALSQGEPVTLLIRPEHIRIAQPGSSGIRATIAAVAFGGPNVRLRAEAPGLPALQCEETSNAAGDLKPGAPVVLQIEPGAWYLVP